MFIVLFSFRQVCRECDLLLQAAGKGGSPLATMGCRYCLPFTSFAVYFISVPVADRRLIMWAAGKGGSPLAVRDIYSEECIQLPDATQHDKTVAMRLAKVFKRCACVEFDV